MFLEKMCHGTEKFGRRFWDQADCGESLSLVPNDGKSNLAHAKALYRIEGLMIFLFARFHESREMSVLEIGFRLVADPQQFAQAGAKLAETDLPDRAVEYARCRLQAFGLHSVLSTGDAEKLAFAD